MRFSALGEVFYEIGPETATARIATYLDEATQAGELAVDDPSMAAEHFVLLGVARSAFPFQGAQGARQG